MNVYRSRRSSVIKDARLHVPRHSWCSPEPRDANCGINLMMRTLKMTSVPLALGVHCAEQTSSSPSHHQSSICALVRCRKQLFPLQHRLTLTKLHLFGFLPMHNMKRPPTGLHLLLVSKDFPQAIQIGAVLLSTSTVLVTVRIMRLQSSPSLLILDAG
jgi:hypothetical protein